MIPYSKTGLQMMAEKQPEKAILEYKTAIVLDPSHLNNYERLGLAYDAVGDLDGALLIRSVVLGMAARNSAEYYFNLYNRALTRREMRDYYGALEDMTEVISLDPKERLAYLHRAEIEIDAGMYHEALEDSERYLSGAQHDEDGLYVRGMARIKYGVPHLYDLGVHDLMKAAENGNEKASIALRNLGDSLAA